jgi:hypothetical protein
MTKNQVLPTSFTLARLINKKITWGICKTKNKRHSFWNSPNFSKCQTNLEMWKSSRFSLWVLCRKDEDSTLHYLLKATRASVGGFVDIFEIRGIIETYRIDLKNSIEKALSQWSQLK